MTRMFGFALLALVLICALSCAHVIGHKPDKLCAITFDDRPNGGGNTTERIMVKLKPGIRDGVIILLHDVQPKPHPTPAALNTLISYLIKEGYQFVTLSDLFKRKGFVPDATTENMYVYVE